MKLYGTMLITGCGGDIPLALARIARKEGLCDRLIGTDIYDDHPGNAFFDQCFVIPRASEPCYFETLAELMAREKVNVLVIGSEPELHAFYEAGIDRVWERMPVIMANREALRVGLDKLTTAETLANAALISPWTQVVSDGMPTHFPCILKARKGSGSRTVRKVANAAEARLLMETHPNDIFQEYLPGEHEEYTCGLYRSCAGEIRTVCFRRRLQGGFTVRGEVVTNEEIDVLLHSIAQLLQLQGSINVQLRLTERGPVVFEINPRFSSTVMFRHLIGFQDFVWSLCEAEGKEIGEFEPPAPGTRIYRVSQEVVLPGDTH